MSNTLEQIQAAEKEAQEMVSSAREEALRLERQAEQEASEKHQREVESALQRSQARVAQAKADAEQEAQPLFASSRQTQDALKNTPSARVDKAAKQIVERIVGNGN